MTASSTHKDKINIATYVPGKSKWEHFRPIVEFCFKNGCEFPKGRSIERPFGVAFQDGESRCQMHGPVTLADILSVFELPDTFKVDESGGIVSIEDDYNRNTFLILSYERKASLDAKNAAYREREKARMAARRARMQREGEK